MKNMQYDFGRQIINKKKLFEDLMDLSLTEFKRKYPINVRDMELYTIKGFNKNLTYKEFKSFGSKITKEIMAELLENVGQNPTNIRECCRIVGKKNKILPEALQQQYYIYRFSKPIFFIKSNNNKKSEFINTKNKY